MNGPLTRDGLRVCTTQCSTCIFRPGNPMTLQPGRVKGMIRDAIRNDSFIVCHQALDGDRAVCRGFFDAYATETLACRLGLVLGTLPHDPAPERV